MHIHNLELERGFKCYDANNMPAYSNWDLSFVPKFAFSQVDEFATTESKSSGEKHISKGIKYYKEQFVHDIKGECLRLNCLLYYFIIKFMALICVTQTVSFYCLKVESD